jgi:hypothetical protein
MGGRFTILMTEKKPRRYAVVRPENGQDEELKPPKRHEVYAVELKPKGRGGSDRALQEFATELQERMNYVRGAGYNIVLMNLIEGRGMLIIVDTQPPENPLVKLHEQAIPLSAIVSSMAQRDDTPQLHPALGELLSNFKDYAVNSGLQQGTEKEKEKLESFVNHTFSRTGGEEIREMLDSLDKVIEHHKKCEDSDDCGFRQFLELTRNTLSGLLTQKLS